MVKKAIYPSKHRQVLIDIDWKSNKKAKKLVKRIKIANESKGKSTTENQYKQYLDLKYVSLDVFQAGIYHLF